MTSPALDARLVTQPMNIVQLLNLLNVFQVLCPSLCPELSPEFSGSIPSLPDSGSADDAKLELQLEFLDDLRFNGFCLL